MAKKLLSQKYRHKQKRMSKMSYSESDADFSNFPINLASDFDSTSKSESDDSESGFNSVF